MHIQTLRLASFRNYKEAFFSFSPEGNLFTGDNAQGKTNLIEALYLLITGRSFRTSHLNDLIQSETESFFIEVSFEKHQIHQTLSIGLSSSEKRLFHNASPLPSTSHLLGLLQGVLLSPEDRSLIAGSPALRRRFLDLHLAQLDPLYIRSLRRYMRALKHRNHLLRQKNHSTLEAWEAHLAKEAAYITKARMTCIDELNLPLQKIHHKLTEGRDPLTLTYKPTLTLDPETNQKAYQKGRGREMIFGHTLIGPHRDDLLLSIAGREVRHFGSEGQKMSCVASLKLAEWERLKERSEEVPLLLIDDLGLGMDPKRKKALQNLIHEAGQVFITSVQNFSLTRETKHYEINAGAVQDQKLMLPAHPLRPLPYSALHQSG